MAPRVDLPGPLGVIDVPPGWRKPCRSTLWGDGAQVAAFPPVPTALDTWFYVGVPYGIARDGTGGAFVLSMTITNWPASQGVLTLRHAGAATGTGAQAVLSQPLSWVGVIGLWTDAAVVSSGSGHAIVGRFDWTYPLAAQRFGTNGKPTWPGNGVRLTGTPIGGSFMVLNLVGEEDGRGGAIFAWRQAAAGGGFEIRAQRVRKTGAIEWKANGTRVAAIPGTQWPSGQPWCQLVATGDGGAIVVTPAISGNFLRLDATPIDAKGSAGNATTIVAATRDRWWTALRPRLAVPDGAGGLYLAYTTPARAPRLLRYTPSQGVRWDIALGWTILEGTLAVREDDRGGVLVGATTDDRPVDTTLKLRRIDANGTTTWDIDMPGASPVRVLTELAGFWLDEFRMRCVHPMPDGTGGAIVVVADISPIGDSGMSTLCIDAQGRLSSGPDPVTARGSVQRLPLATAVGVERAVVAWSDDVTIGSQAWEVWAQRVGCCVPQGDAPPPPPFGCEIVPLPGSLPGEFTFSFPCGLEERPFGVIPLSRFLATLKGVSVPGGLLSHDAPAPDWARLAFLGVPDKIAISLVTLSGKRVADAVSLPGALPKGIRNDVRTLTFAPPAKADLLLVVSREGRCERDALWSMRATLAYGDGRAPAISRSMRFGTDPPPPAARRRIADRRRKPRR